MSAGAGAMELMGARELQRTLKELGPKIEQKVTLAAMKKAAIPIRRAARANARRILGRRSEARLTRLYEAGAAKRAWREKHGTLHPRRKGVKSPVRTRKQSTKAGQLARSIKIKGKRYTAGGVVFVVIGPGWPEGAHGHLVEYGHQPSGWYARQAGAKFVRARAFMRPAWDTHKREALTIAIQQHRARVEREAQKATYHARAGWSKFGGLGHTTGVTWQQIESGK